ncbi:MAG: hypothetical protein AAF292_12825 [Pseudomonadota bacterium]
MSEKIRIQRALAILSFDLRTLRRDGFLATVAGLSALLMIGIAIIGVYREDLDVEHLQTWIPYLIIMFLVSNVGTYGMLFGLVFVEEVETRVRAALMVVPVPPVELALLRTANVFLWLIVQPVLLSVILAAGWDLVQVSVFDWFLLCLSLAPLGAVFMIVLSTVASNRVEALAMGKFFSAATIPPMLLYIIADDAWYRHLFLVFPTAPAVHAFEALRAESATAAMTWMIVGAMYALILGALSMRQYVRKSYGISA